MSDKAFGIRLATNTQIVQLAQNAGFDSLFIELEHSTLSIDDASRLSMAGLHAGITPFVRVPHQCGNGFVQRVLDGGAMGVIFPHIQNAGKPCQRGLTLIDQLTKYPLILYS
jgi:2-keto-3-deoxy-L-rhamnonate aldolase RhmA